MSEKKFVTKEAVALVFTVLSFFGGFVAYAEKRLESIEQKARQELSENVGLVAKQVDNEKQERQEATRQMNAKLDLLINLVANLQRKGS